MSVLHKAFPRKDLTVVALYMETCDGVPDHAAEVRRQSAKHNLPYPVLDAEAGPVRDPTSERMAWAPRALVVDGEGRILRVYPYMPRMKTLQEDLTALVETDRFPERADDGWREFPPKAWVTVRIEGRARPRTERRVLQFAGRDGATVHIGDREERLFREDLNGTVRDYARVEKEREAMDVDGRKMKARVFEATWKRVDASFRERRWIADGALVRRELVETAADGSTVTRNERLVKWRDPLLVDEREITCRVHETVTSWKDGRTTERVWTNGTVPGNVVRAVRKGEGWTESETVTAFGLR